MALLHRTPREGNRAVHGTSKPQRSAFGRRWDWDAVLERERHLRHPTPAMSVTISAAASVS